jgi:hypothetical protein
MMSESKFTPGPWMLKKEYDSWSIRQKGSTKRHAGFTTYTEICEGVAIKQDAKLIAAAPCLLDALKRIHASLEQTHDSGDVGRYVAGELAIARAAIEKATA